MEPSALNSCSPEQRRRRSMAREAVFTVSMAGPDVQRRFVVRQRALFVLQVLGGLGAMFLAALVFDAPDPDLLWPLAGGAAFLLILSAVTRLRSRRVQVVSFCLGLLAAGLVIGWVVPQGPDRIDFLLNPAILLGVLLAGAAFNGLVSRRQLSPWVEFLLTVPWLAAALFLVWFFPAGEWVLLASGVLAMLLLYCMHRAGRESLPIYQHSEVLVAAADVVPLACIATFGWLLGRD